MSCRSSPYINQQARTEIFLELPNKNQAACKRNLYRKYLVIKTLESVR